ncbi:uncharacterized protein PV09_04660 [Verruconis gallopava]|uniref:Uncharacterized protein n=1 Tax=Verruconis gallopava TaxID=253628 RepID=A0A0D1XP81_9PEZI|nr:uncharacterized protein PV09_04660 [Verruconis gallopava]KIW04376.1 hypothetical protein PV09_04660 [Verruconis gallopava]
MLAFAIRTPRSKHVLTRPPPAAKRKWSHSTARLTHTLPRRNNGFVLCGTSGNDRMHSKDVWTFRSQPDSAHLKLSSNAQLITKHEQQVISCNRFSWRVLQSLHAGLEFPNVFSKVL